jgi:hypothetical protein
LLVDYEKYLKQYDEISDLYNQITSEIFEFRPFEEAWTIQEHFVHIIDSELNAFLRFKTILAESGKEVMVLDEKKWIKGIDSNKISIKNYLKIFGLLREFVVEYVKDIDEKTWHENYILHSAVGRITLIQLLEGYIGHVQEHIDYIQRNRSLFGKSE